MRLKCLLTALLTMTVLFLFAQNKSANVSSTTTFVIRLLPGEDLRKSIQAFVEKQEIKAGWISTAVGSLTRYNIRFANQPGGSTGDGHFEIVSLTGTLSVNGSHIHVSVSDSTGKTTGGHLLEGCTVFTTVEIVIQSTNEYEFSREKDGTTPWEELQIKRITDK